MYNNELSITGILKYEFNLDHEFEGEQFFRNALEVQRLSGEIDTIPIIVSEKMIRENQEYKDLIVVIRGQFRSFNRHEDDKTHLDLYIFPESMTIVSECDNDNDIFLEGYICKQPNIRETPRGRIISDVLMAVNRYFGKSDYIPVIMWGRNAYSVAQLHPGDYIRVAGRIQSRSYTKGVDIRTVYEISASKFEAVR